MLLCRRKKGQKSAFHCSTVLNAQMNEGFLRFVVSIIVRQEKITTAGKKNDSSNRFLAICAVQSAEKLKPIVYVYSSVILLLTNICAQNCFVLQCVWLLPRNENNQNCYYSWLSSKWIHWWSNR